jgi:hypothetical protein
VISFTLNTKFKEEYVWCFFKGFGMVKTVILTGERGRGGERERREKLKEKEGREKEI